MTTVDSVRRVLEKMDERTSFTKMESFIEKLSKRSNGRHIIETLAKEDSGLDDFIRIQLKLHLPHGWWGARTVKQIRDYGGRRKTNKRKSRRR